MLNIDIIRAWKDPQYRESLDTAALAALPAHPGGPMELSDEDLDVAAGAATLGLCNTSGPDCSTCCRCPNTATWSNSCCSW
jgi:mersacidin/lichenicidin family type 2 lantibiotic